MLVWVDEDVVVIGDFVGVCLVVGMVDIFVVWVDYVNGDVQIEFVFDCFGSVFLGFFVNCGEYSEFVVVVQVEG